ncbi:MAG: flagellar basal body P-ring protein FlgI, partial [Deltaproteobacteria bacterium]|nr:flagellar basal body P-ring protein FlgI [Deltaproteobacteria bacterium]
MLNLTSPAPGGPDRPVPGRPARPDLLTDQAGRTFRRRRGAALLLAALAWAVAWTTPAQAIRLKELATFEGGRFNQITGYGLVVGLNGTGDKDQTGFTRQSLSNM